MVVDKADGASGGRRAATTLSLALCAEAAHTTMDEDGAKVDLKLSFQNPFSRSTLITTHCQVKSGHSYRARSSNATTLTLTHVDAETISALSNGTQPALLVWVPPKPLRDIYYHVFANGKTQRTPIKIPRAHVITPALRYDLAKSSCVDRARAPRQDVANLQEHALMDSARSNYRCLKTGEWRHPLFGKLFVTRRAWRHVTRRSKSTRRRLLALRALRHLHVFLDKAPDRYLVSSVRRSVSGRVTTESREVLCWYERAMVVDTVERRLLLRVREDITYPTDWLRDGVGLKGIHQKATLLSWWCK